MLLENLALTIKFKILQNNLNELKFIEFNY